ncbi:MAG: LbtU family siderophore porin [Candidatus Aquirickettsiella sp.]
MLSNKYKLTTIMAVVCWLGLQGNVALADENTQASDDSEIRRLAQRTQVLESELRRVQNQVATLRRQPSSAKTSPTEISSNESAAHQSLVTSLHPFFIIGTPVISSPFIGINSEFNASDLVVNQPYVNEDLFLLQQRKQINNYLQQTGHQLSNTPIINLSGKIESQIYHTSHFANFQNNSATDIDLTGIELDTEILVNQWVTGLIAFVYDNTPPTDMSPRRIDNSRVLLERGFLTVGNLIKFPLYMTMGQFYVPFGQYSSSMISDPFTKILGRTKTRALELALSKQFNDENNLNLSAFVFRGPSRTSIDNNGLRNYGANAEYIFTKPKWNIDIAGSYIRSIADSIGMQHNGNNGTNNFAGFATNNNTEVLNPVSGLDARGTLSIKAFSLTGEYVTASRSFSQTVLSFDGQGAKPSAFHAEAEYKFNVLEKPSAIIIGYDQSKDALGLLIPKKRYIATASTSIWKDTIESLELRHDIDYSANDVALGQSGLGLNPINGTGKSGNTVTLQIGLYF